MEWHQFAMVLRIPEGREADWSRLLSRAVSPSNLRCTPRTPTLLIFEVEAEMEFLAIEKAEQWLNYLTTQALPPFKLGTNAQPAHEIES